MQKTKCPFENARVKVQGQKKKRENEIIGIVWEFYGGNRDLWNPRAVEMYKTVSEFMY